METNPTTTTQAHVVATLTKFWTLPMGTASTTQLKAMRTQVLTIMGHAITRDWHTAEDIGDDILKAIATEEDRRTLARAAR